MGCMRFNPQHQFMAAFLICGGRWPSYSSVCQTMRHPGNWSSQRNRPNGMAYKPLCGKMNTKNMMVVSFFLYDPHKPQWSEVGTVDVPTSVCSVQTVWATLWNGEILTKMMVFSVLL
jgi:hypothetical protein